MPGHLPDLTIAGYKKYLMEKIEQPTVVDHSSRDVCLRGPGRCLERVRSSVGAYGRTGAKTAQGGISSFERKKAILAEHILDREMQILSDQFQMSPIASIVDLAESEPRLVVLGDPGSGKTALLNYLTVRWCAKDGGRMPFRVDLREYARNQQGFISFLSKSASTFQMDASVLTEMFEKGDAVLQCDGLDEQDF